MAFFDFFSSKNRVLGIDIGTAGIKIVELEKNDGRFELTNYGLTQGKVGDGFRTKDLKTQQVGELIKKILKEMESKTKKAIISLPLASSFSTLIEIPKMPGEELEAAIPFEAKKYIPVSIEEVMLDWAVVEETGIGPNDPMIKARSPQAGKKVQVLLVAVPKETIKRYTEAAKSAGLELLALEIEAFAMARSLVAGDPQTYLILDFGTKGTNVLIVDKGAIRFSYNIESTDENTVLKETERIVNLYKSRYNKNISRCIMGGGSINFATGERESGEKKWAAIIKERIGLEASFGNPLARLDYPEKLKGILSETAPSLAVAVGLAMK